MPLSGRRLPLLCLPPTKIVTGAPSQAGAGWGGLLVVFGSNFTKAKLFVALDDRPSVTPLLEIM